jgi:hypothetical protein
LKLFSRKPEVSPRPSDQAKVAKGPAVVGTG